jgi:hypothetical protein
MIYLLFACFGVFVKGRVTHLFLRLGKSTFDLGSNRSMQPAYDRT